MKENYFITCDTCDSRFELICINVSYEDTPEYCPFCGSLVDDEDGEDDEEKDLDD